MLFITDEEELKLNNKKQALYFYSSWMPLHKKMLTMLEKIEEQHKDMQFFAIDVDFFKNFIKRFDLKFLPTILVFDNGRKIKRIKGMYKTAEMIEMFDGLYVAKPPQNIGAESVGSIL